MSTALLDKYMEERQTLSELIDNTLGRVDAEERDLVPAEIETLESSKTRMQEIDVQVGAIKDTLERRNAQLDVTHLTHKAAAREKASVQVVAEHRQMPSLGDFVDSAEFRSFGFAGSSDRAVMDMRITETRAALTTGTSPGSAFIPQPQKLMIPEGIADFPLLGAVNRVPVSTNAVDMVTYGSPKGATGATKVAEGSQKPEATLVASSTPVTLETWAYWVEVTRQLLQDAPAARSFIDEQLRTGLLTTVEKDISDTIAAAATIPATTGAAGEASLVVIRKAIATVQAKGFRPNAILASPETAADIDLSLMAGTLNGAVFGVRPWGLDVIPVAGLTKTYVGDFNRGMALLERTGIEVFITDSGITGSGSNAKDRFTNNLFAILAEVRSKAVLVQPHAMSEVKLTAKAP